MAKAHNLSGRAFGRLTVTQRADNRAGKPAWYCACECGTLTVVTSANLKSGSTVSCGCWKDELLASRATTHGLSRTAAYSSWGAMMERCYDPRHPYFSKYGGRGIVVCQEWHDFSVFFRDMGERPEGHTLDRKEGNEGYSLSNCQWATRKMQAANRRYRTAQRFAHGREALTVREIANRLGTYPAAVRARLRNGWSVSRILSSEVHSHA